MFKFASLVIQPFVSALLKLSNQVTVLNANKARNILIAKRRISLKAGDLNNAINTCDSVTLTPECAELLLKFTPTTDEVQFTFKDTTSPHM